MDEQRNLLEIRDLRVSFPVDGEIIRAVNGISLTLGKGESLGVVGESGCGKSVTFSSVMRLVKSPPAVIEGEVMLDGLDIMRLSEKQMKRVRGKEVAMIFQEPMRSLNPVMLIGKQITEALLLHERMTPREAWSRALELLKLVEVPDAESRLHSYPHQLSGGLRQRVYDRHGAGLPAEDPAGRRADNGAGRDDPGADSGSAQAPAGGNGHEYRHDHARPGRGGGHRGQRGGLLRRRHRGESG